MPATKLFTISDLAKCRVALLYDPVKHTKEQLAFVLSIAFSGDTCVPVATVKSYYFASCMDDFWAVSVDAPLFKPVQSLELFQAD